MTEIQKILLPKSSNNRLTSHLKGKFITLEGPEGSGKSTQAELITDYFKEKGLPVVRTREPGGVSISEQLREILLKPGNIIYPQAELLLYAAGRAQHTMEFIIPALKEGKYVICERYTHASIAYQGYGRGLDLGLIKKLNEIASQGVCPIITIILDIEVEEGLQRVRSFAGGLDRLESENISFHKRVRAGYLKIATNDAAIVVVNATSSAEKIHENIVSILKDRKII